MREGAGDAGKEPGGIGGVREVGGEDAAVNAGMTFAEVPAEGDGLGLGAVAVDGQVETVVGESLAEGAPDAQRPAGDEGGLAGGGGGGAGGGVGHDRYGSAEG